MPYLGHYLWPYFLGVGGGIGGSPLNSQDQPSGLTKQREEKPIVNYNASKAKMGGKKMHV